MIQFYMMYETFVIYVIFLLLYLCTRFFHKFGKIQSLSGTFETKYY